MTTAFSRLLLPSENCLWLHTVQEFSAELSQTAIIVAEITDRHAEEPLYQLSQKLGNRLLVPEVWQKLLPEAGILISSQVSGGTLVHRLEDAQKQLPGRCWLRVEPFAQHLSLPCPSGCGEDVPTGRMHSLLSTKQVFFSSELGCSYLYDFPKGVILFRQKNETDKLSEIARQAGFCGTVEGPW